jgi:hypothetical protein
MGSGHLPSDFRPQVGEIGTDHFASIVLVSDTFGQSLAFFLNLLMSNLPQHGISGSMQVGDRSCSRWQRFDRSFENPDLLPT